MRSSPRAAPRWSPPWRSGISTAAPPMSACRRWASKACHARSGRLWPRRWEPPAARLVRRRRWVPVPVTDVTTPRQGMREGSAMGRWTAETTITALPADVLAQLTSPDAISRWAPVPFDVVDWEGERLRAGERVRVQGRLAGRALEFEVDVAEADDDHLVLTATGPI